MSGDAWSGLATEIRTSPTQWSCEAFGELYLAAIEDGCRLLRAMRNLDEERRRDLAIATLIGKREEVVSADRPRAFFRTVLWRDAISWQRSARSRVASCDECEACHAKLTSAHDTEEERAHYRIDGLTRLGSLDARSLAMLFADATGETRDDIARRLGTSRANVDQIISLARRRAMN